MGCLISVVHVSLFSVCVCVYTRLCLHASMCRGQRLVSGDSLKALHQVFETGPLTEAGNQQFV